MSEVQSAISTLAEYDEAEWVLQFYVNDDLALELWTENWPAYVLEANEQHPSAQSILESALPRPSCANSMRI